MHAARRVVSVATRRRQFSKFAFVGAGKMAEAMLAPLQETTIEGGTPSVSFYDVSCAVSKRVAEKYPQLTRAESLDECVNDADVVVLARRSTDAVAARIGAKPRATLAAHASIRVARPIGAVRCLLPFRCNTLCYVAR